LLKRIVTYGIKSSEAKYRATEIEMKGTRTKATIWRGGEIMGDLELQVPGEYNMKNALATIAVGEILAIPFETTRKALKKFTGAERRFDAKGEVAGVLVIDDYAHHPTEIVATLTAVKRGYPGRRVIACFQPHTFTRTRDFGQAFGEAFVGNADELVLLDIYPAREEPIAGISSDIILKAANAGGMTRTTRVETVESLPDVVLKLAKAGDIVLTIGAGTITNAAPEILERLKRAEKPRITTNGEAVQSATA
jgi:UDP-N-acetylmuramate--alanine ligase